MARRSQVNAQRIQRLPGTKMQAASRRVGDFGNYIGARKALVILVNFSDVNFAEGHDNALFQRIANEVGFNEGNFVGSMYDYFYAQSEGQFELTFDVLGPVTVSKTQSYYGGNDSSGNDMHPEEMVKEAVEQIMDQVTDWKQYDWDNDGYVDQVYLIYAGNGEADLHFFLPIERIQLHVQIDVGDIGLEAVSACIARSVVHTDISDQ